MKTAAAPLDRPLYDAGYRPGLARLVMRVLHAFGAVWFRFELRGVENVPRERCLWVGNHSAIGIADVLTILGAGHSHFAHRRVVGMMHDLFVSAPLLGRLCRGFGAVAANRAAARAALDEGLDVMCYPGGNLDSCRPLTQPRSVVFGDHRGYVRVALASGVKVLPLATIGSAYTYLLLPSDRWARWIRLDRWSRDERLPVPLASLGVVAALALAALGWISAWWILAAVVVLVVPNPVRITTRVLEPIDVCGQTAHIEDPEARVEAAHALVHGRLAEAVRAMQH